MKMTHHKLESILLRTWYTTKYVPQSISMNSEFSSATLSMKALLAGKDGIVVQRDVPTKDDSGYT